MQKITVSDTPHIRSKLTTKRIMLDVIIAVVPSLVAGIVYFGGKAAFTVAVSVLSCCLTEWIWLLVKKTPIKQVFCQFDFSSIVTGLLLGLSMPPLEYKYFYIPLLAGIFAVGVVKMLFGGTGKNVVNPAVTGRVFAFISFLGAMTSGWAQPAFGSLSGEVLSGATVLTDMLAGVRPTVSNVDLLLGTGITGCIGETCKVAILAGFVYLVVRRIIKWQWPVIVVGVSGLVSVLLNGCDFSLFLPYILSGGLIFGAVFMATDYVTSPSNNLARYFYYILMGAIIALLREGTGIETVSFAILLLNLLVPLFSLHIRPRPFGSVPIGVVIKEKLSRLTQKGGKQ